MRDARPGSPSPASLRSATSQPCGHFGTYPPYRCRGVAAPSPATRGEVILGASVAGE